MPIRQRAKGQAPEQSPVPKARPTATAGANSETQVAPEKEEAGWLARLGAKGSDLIDEQVDKNVNSEKFGEVVDKTVDSGEKKAYEFLLEQLPDDQKKLFMEHGPGMLDQLGGGAKDLLGGLDFTSGAGDFLKDNKLLTAGLGVAGAAGYILSDQPLDGIGGDFSFGKEDQHTLGLEGDFGSTMDLGFEGVRGSYGYKRGDHEFALEGGRDFQTGDWDAQARYKQQMGDDASWSLGASHREEGGESKSKLGFNYDSKELDAHAGLSYDSATELGRFNAGFQTDRPGKTNFNGGFDAATNGEWNANLGASYKAPDSNLEWFAKAGAGQAAGGDTNLSASAGLSFKF